MPREVFDFLATKRLKSQMDRKRNNNPAFPLGRTRRREQMGRTFKIPAPQNRNPVKKPDELLEKKAQLDELRPVAAF